jgi:hypothetical protein
LFAVYITPQTTPSHHPMVLAEKIVTALQRGSASTRWRDFGDVYQLTSRHIFHAAELRQARPDPRLLPRGLNF